MQENLITADAVRSATTQTRRLGERLFVPAGTNRVDFGVMSAATGLTKWHTQFMSADEALVAKLTAAFPELNFVHNARTAAGAQWEASLLGNAAGTPANYMAITTDSTAVANGDTIIASELTTNGLARMPATYAYLTAQATLGATAQYTLQGQWTYTGSSPVIIAKAGLLNAASAGTLVFEAVLSPTITVNANGDVAKVLWTVTI